MSDLNAEESFKSIVAAAESVYEPIVYLKIGALAALVIYIIFFPLYGSKISYWDAISARKVVTILRYLVLIETIVMLPLFYCVIALGSPLPKLNATTQLDLRSIGYNASWIYDYGRPVVNFLLIGLGTFGDMHSLFRISCLVGSAMEVVFSTMAAFQVFDYYLQVKSQGAPTGLFTRQLIYAYFMRDIVSGCVCMLLTLYCIHVLFLLGWFPPQLIPFSVIAGGDLDRCQVMRNQRVIKKRCEFKHVVIVLEDMKQAQALFDDKDHP